MWIIFLKWFFLKKIYTLQLTWESHINQDHRVQKKILNCIKIINQLSKKTNSRIFAVLEGGYTKQLGYLIEQFVKSFD